MRLTGMGKRATYRFPFGSYPAVRIAVLLIAGIIVGEQLYLSPWIPALIILLIAGSVLMSELQKKKKIGLIRTRLMTGSVALLILHCMRGRTSRPSQVLPTTILCIRSSLTTKIVVLLTLQCIRGGAC